MTAGGQNLCSWRAPLLALCCAVLVSPCWAHTLLQTVFGEVGAENYTYYRISRPGTLVLTLHTLDGDADVFVSDQTLKPTFSEYEAQSVTCGLDSVEIPITYSRPVGVAVFGTANYDLSRYKLEIFVIAEEVVNSYAFLNDDPNRYEYQHSGPTYESYLSDASSPSYESYSSDATSYVPSGGRTSKEGDADDSPYWWTLLVDILKIVFEVII